MPDNLLAPERLKSKLGKLPVWAWGVIGATIILIGYYITRSRKNARVADVTANPSAGDANPLSAFFGLANPSDTNSALLPSGNSGVSNGGGAEVSGGGDTSTSIDTNLSWLNKGIAISVQKGNHTSLGSTTALQKYLAGKPLNVYEQDVIGIVLNNLGYPPEGAPIAVKAVKDAVGKPVVSNPTPVVKKPTKVVVPKPTPTVVVPKPTPTVVVPKVVAPKLGADGYPLNSSGKQIVQYYPYGDMKIVTGKFIGRNVNLNYRPDDFQYVKFDNTIPASPTH